MQTEWKRELSTIRAENHRDFPFIMDILEYYQLIKNNRCIQSLDSEMRRNL